MSKVFKAVAILGNAAEIIIAGSVLADVVMKLRGNRKDATGKNKAETEVLEPKPLAA